LKNWVSGVFLYSPLFHYSIIPFLDSLRALHPLGLSFLFRIPNSGFRIWEAFMALLTGKEYVESLKEFSPEVYIRGERVQQVWSHPLLRQTVNHIAAGYDFARDPRYRASAAVQSPLTGEEVPRIQLHIQESL
jgi:hypothetical protein